jgi:hypothetical protein
MFHFFNNASNNVGRYAFDHIPKSKLQALYGLRKLRTDYKGYAIRVRRSSDNAELDIGFIGEDLDIIILLVFVGVGNGFIVTTYDQSGKGNHVTQTTVTNQPRIVNAGVIEVENTRPTIKHDGTDDFLENNSFAVSNICSLSLVAVNKDVINSARRIVMMGDSTGSTNNLHIFHNGSTTQLGAGVASPVDARVFLNTALNTLSIVTMSRVSTTNTEAWKNGMSLGTSTISNVDWTSQILRIGCNRSGSANALYFPGTISEVAITTPLTDIERKKLERNQGKYYGITVA